LSDIAFTIGRLGAETGVNVETIRYYERIGLMPRPPRSAANRRLYDNAARERLSFVRRARELGFSIDLVRALLSLSSGEGRCTGAHALTVQHLSNVRERIADLKKLERTLSRAAQQCAPAASPHCPIIEALSRPLS
jgi:MerR family transcriptional regulator, mercuric resistance operon regulatory protein